MRSFFSFIAAILSAASLAAQQPATAHARLTAEAAPNGPGPVLARLEASGQTTWLAYAIPTARPIHIGGQSSHVAYLEGEEHGQYLGPDDAATPPQDYALLLFRISDHQLGKLRVESPLRTLDAGGLPIVFLTGVSPESSLDTLKSLALSSNASDRPLRDAAVFSISLHRSPATVPTLASLTDPSRDTELREKAAFWLASSESPEAFATLQHLARTDADARFREKLAFDLTVNKQPAALEELIRMAHADPSPQVRRQAQFWMGTIGGKRVTADLRVSAESDPDTEVRKSAVFGLAQLPKEEAAPQLIQVAETNKNPEVRKQAVFWLGQSSDPRALDFLTKLLTQ